MASFLNEFKHLEIKLEDIKSATNNFDEKNVIGHGGFGKVYEGKLAFPHSEGEILVALKRLDRKYGQGDPEFYKEIRFLSCYRHENLISLLGFCNQGGEMILVYEHASGGSLDRILNSAALTWPQRLKICLDAAKGISFLHDPNGAHQRVLHCDIKSANILLDKNMNAKVSDFGLSKMGPANQQYSALITNAAGTPGYCDPLFIETYCLTKESDVYSFGVVLLEVLCGRLCAEFSNGRLNTIFVPMWKKSYKEKKLDDIIFKDLKQQMDQKSLETFAGIAFQCLQKYREQRPPMSLVVQKLKIALQFQDPVSFNFSDSLEIIKAADTSLTYKGLLVNGGKMLQALVDSHEKKVDDTDKRSEETNKISEERLKQALDAETQIMQLKMAMQRLQEKVSDVTSENQILRQQAFSSPTKHVPENENTPETNSSVENGLGGSEEPQARARKSVTESHSKPKKSLIDLQHDNVDALIECVMRDTGFSQGKHVAAFTIYKCLLHWESFEAEKTSVFDRLIQMIGSAIENEDNNEHMAYWLSNTSALVFLIQKSLKPKGASSVRKSPHPTSLFGRMTMGLRSSSVSLAAPALEVVRQVEAKYPALLFKQQLIAYVEKIYGIVRDNLKKELGSLLSLCIQAPRASKGVRRSGMSFGKDSQSNHWQSIVDCLNTLLKTLQDNFVPPVIVQMIFCQVFSYINVQLFNSLLLRRECCSFSNGEYVKAGLAELELWCCEAKEEYVGSAWDELKHVRQAIGFLVIRQKYRISYDELTNDLCPVLSVQQLYRICTLYWDDKYNTRSVSPEVISSMRLLMAEDSNTVDSSSFLLDDNSSIPFSVDDLSTSLQVKDFADVKPAVELAENPAFLFLL